MNTVSVILINFNGMDDLAPCLESLLAQDHPSLELVAIDNASSDGSREWLRRWADARPPDGPLAAGSVTLIENESNTGFSPALNQGIAASSGEVVMPLNTDVVLGGSFVSNLVKRLGEPGVGSASGKLLRFPAGGEDNIIDTAGHEIFRNRLAWNLAEGRPGGTEFVEPMEIWGTCGAAAVYSRCMLDDVAVNGEIFDEDFFAFWEDLDLDWRARLRGWRCVFEPSALGWHRRGGAGYRKSLLVERHNFKNRYLMMIKNDSARYVLRNLPGIIAVEVLKGGALLLRCPRALAGYADVVRLLPLMVAKRRVIQSRRMVPARELEQWFRPFDYSRWIRRHLLNRGEMTVEESGTA
jgi:GT2 family glycosyltransferase